MPKKRNNMPENVDARFFEELENFLREGLRALGFNLGKRRRCKRESIFWFWVSKKGPFHLPTVMLDVSYSKDKISLGLLESGLSVEEVLTQLLEEFQEETGSCFAVEKQVFVF